MGDNHEIHNDDEDFMPSIFHTQHRPSQFFPHALPQSFLGATTYEALKTGDGGYDNATAHGGCRGGPRGVRKSLSASYISLLSAVACADQLGMSMAPGSGDHYPHHRGERQGPGLGEDHYEEEQDHGGVFIDEEDQQCDDDDRLGSSFLLKMGGASRGHHPHHDASLLSMSMAQGQGPRKTRRVGSFSSTLRLTHPAGSGGSGVNAMMMSGESASDSGVSDSGGSTSEGVSSSNHSNAAAAKWSSVQGISHQISNTPR